MSANPITETRTEVTLLRLGSGRETIELPEGATLGDLLRLTEMAVEPEQILIDGKPLLDCLILQRGAIVSVSPKPAARRWSDLAGGFDDDPAFDQMMEQVEQERAAEKDTA